MRELGDELGLDTPYAELQPLGIRQTAVTLAPDWIEHEFQFWHLIPLGLDVADIPGGHRSLRARRSRLDDAIALVRGETTEAPARHLVREGWHGHRRIRDGALRREDLIPGYRSVDQLYLRMFIAARRYLSGDCTPVLVNGSASPGSVGRAHPARVAYRSIPITIPAWSLAVSTRS
ncbi:hypothetical protein GCM10023224_16160 [Streptomonospora halophila]|uniref:Uncharacterized protein n=1 Tax=Streptomonospora halophila TaxID=427369 RepID=A0ABP9GJP3_9ACTN